MSCASLLKTYCTFQTIMTLCTHFCFVSYSSPEAAVHSQGNVSGGAEQLNVEVLHVLRLDVRLPPIGALCSLEPLWNRNAHDTWGSPLMSHRRPHRLLWLLTVLLHKHLPHRLALTLRGREQGVLEDGRGGVGDDVVLFYVELIRERRLDHFWLPKITM